MRKPRARLRENGFSLDFDARKVLAQQHSKPCDARVAHQQIAARAQHQRRRAREQREQFFLALRRGEFFRRPTDLEGGVRPQRLIHP